MFFVVDVTSKDVLFCLVFYGLVDDFCEAVVSLSDLGSFMISFVVARCIFGLYRIFFGLVKYR
jgi:hypothetical protein